MKKKFLFARTEISCLISAILLGLLNTSCYLFKSPENLILEKRALIEEDFQKELARQKRGDASGELKVTWNQALEKMYMENPSLLEADFKVEDAVIQQKKVYTSLLPLLTVGANDSFEIKNIDEAFDDVRLRIYSYLPLGDLIRLPKKIYRKKMYYISAQLQAEQTMRQQVIALYRLFQQQYLLDLEHKALLLEEQLTKNIGELQNTDTINAVEEHKKSFLDWKKRKNDWKIAVGDFFMDNFVNIDLMRQSLPRIKYNPSQLNFTNSGRWGMLQLNLLAIEKIAKDANLLETYLRYFPQANFYVSAPPLYSNDQSFAFDPNDIRLGPSINWRLDTQGDIALQLNRLKREAPIKDWRKDKRRRKEIKKLLDGKKALIEIQEELRKVRKVIEGYRSAVKTGLVNDPQKAISTMRRLREKEVRLAAKEIDICTSFWLIDEHRWAKITKRWQKTRKMRAKKRKEERKKKDKKK